MAVYPLFAPLFTVDVKELKVLFSKLYLSIIPGRICD
jgi:hypothetical protein